MGTWSTSGVSMVPRPHSAILDEESEDVDAAWGNAISRVPYPVAKFGLNAVRYAPTPDKSVEVETDILRQLPPEK